MPGSPLRVLIVDDNPDAVEMLRVLLEMAHHTVWTAPSGEAALRTAERVRPDAVLLDIGLPDLDGYGVCRALRGQPWGRDMLIAALTGWSDEETQRRAVEAGFDVHLTKPVEASVIIEVLRSVTPG